MNRPTLSPIDRALQAQVGLVAAPLQSKLEPLSENGRRYLLGKQGLYLEYKTPWIHIVEKVDTLAGSHQSPFGEINPFCEFTNAQGLKAAVFHFASGCFGDPVEQGAYLTFDRNRKTYHTTKLKAIKATESFLRYESKPIPQGHFLVGDIHTHGFSNSFFSATDNKDDSLGYKLAFVVGNLDRKEPSVKARVCLGGVFCHEQSMSFTSDAP